MNSNINSFLEKFLYKFDKKIVEFLMTLNYDTVFKMESYDSENNNDYYKSLGDISLQNYIVKYIFDKNGYGEVCIPSRKCIITDLKIYIIKPEYISKYLNDIFPEINGFIKYDSNREAPNIELEEYMTNARFSVFVSLLGFIEKSLVDRINPDNSTNFRISYEFCYSIVFNILYSMERIKLEYSILKEYVSILKELCDKRGIKIEYKTERLNGENITEIFTKNDGKRISEGTAKISEGTAKTKDKSRNLAAKKALEYFSNKGINYEITSQYNYKRDDYKRDDYKKATNQNDNLIKQKIKDYLLFIFKQFSTEAKCLKKEILDDPNILLNISDDLLNSIKIQNLLTNDHPDNNYEALETYGDNLLNKCVVWYLSYTFPQLRCSAGKELLLKTKTKTVSTDSYANLCKSIKLNELLKYIYNTEIKDSKILEDIFESFFGALEKSIDSVMGIGFGYAFVYPVISKILFTYSKIGLAYTDLVDPKTHLKELIDVIKNEYGNIKYINKTDKSNNMHYCMIKTDKDIVLGTSQMFFVGDLKDIQQQLEFETANKAVKFFRQKGIKETKSEKYNKFC